MSIEGENRKERARKGKLKEEERKKKGEKE